MLGLVVIVAVALSREIPRSHGLSGAALGREVYISEGCIHCHSQYVRPDTIDEEWWGPARSPDSVLAECPPLIGNRRQGPDLTNVGNRRFKEWMRWQLTVPRELVPNSRMPSYTYLFRTNDARGSALIEYLVTLGSGTEERRYGTRAQWRPKAATPVEAKEASALYESNCEVCHGREGRGNGPLANRLAPRPPRDLTLARWEFIPKVDTGEKQRTELMRVIKFGIPGTAMAGHETLSDGQLLGLAKYVEALRRPDRPGETASASRNTGKEERASGAGGSRMAQCR